MTPSMHPTRSTGLGEAEVDRPTEEPVRYPSIDSTDGPTTESGGSGDAPDHNE